MKNNILVSFIIVSYNQEEYISSALDSAFSQDYKNIQYIISDDGSTDKTPDIIKSFLENKKCIFLSNEINLGIVGNLNQAFSYAKGDIIIVMAGDDMSESNRVSTIVQYFNDSPNTFGLYSNTTDIDKFGNIVENSEYGDKYHARNGNMTVMNFLKHDLGMLGCSAAYRKEIIAQPLPSGLPSEDKYLTLKCLLNGNIKYINEKLVRYRLGTGISNNLGIRSKKEYIKLLHFKIRTLDGIRSELSDINHLAIVDNQREFIIKALQCLENGLHFFPFYNGFHSVSQRDKIKYIFYRYFQ